MRVFMGEKERMEIETARSEVGGLLLYGGTPVGTIEEDGLHLIVPEFFEEFERDGVVMPQTEGGEFYLFLLTDEDTNFRARISKGGWLIEMLDEETPVAMWTERFTLE